MERHEKMAICQNWTDSEQRLAIDNLSLSPNNENIRGGVHHIFCADADTLGIQILNAGMATVPFAEDT
jgi:hypothetical protein